MSEPAKRAKRGSRVGCGCLAALVLIGAIVAFNNRPPAVEIPGRVMPNPNARDYFLRAVASVATNTRAQNRRLVQVDAGVLSTLREGLRYPYMEPSTKPGNLVVQQLSQLFTLAGSISFDAEVEASDGDWNEAADTALDIMQMGEAIPHGATIVGAESGEQICSLGRTVAWDAPGHVSAGEARQCAKRLAEIDALHVSSTDSLREEKWWEIGLMAEQLRSANFSASMRGSGAASQAQTFYMLAYVCVAGKGKVLMDTGHAFDWIIAAAARPYSPAFPKPPDGGNPITRTVISRVFPSLLGLRVQELIVQTENRLLQASFALRAYRLEHGTYPDSLDALVAGGYLTSVPQDPFSPGSPLRYRRTGATYVLYSVGPDGKDDGGRPMYDTRLAARSLTTNNYVVQDRDKGDIVAGVNR